MALSNIFNEPRREITESVVGLIAFGFVFCLCAWGDYSFALWLQGVTGGPRYGMPWPGGLVMGFIGTIVGSMFVVLLLVLTHALGDAICNALQRRGIYLRPRQRRL